jgi:hypothetical protein
VAGAGEGCPADGSDGGGSCAGGMAIIGRGFCVVMEAEWDDGAAASRSGHKTAPSRRTAPPRPWPNFALVIAVHPPVFWQNASMPERGATAARAGRWRDGLAALNRNIG